MVKSLLRDRITVIWLGLIVATLASWTLGVGHGLPHQYAAIGIIVIALIKVHFIGRYFMELRHAPTVLMAVFEGWVLLAGAVLIGLYTFA